jgi:lysophospholipase L1-like esterase
LLNTQAQQLYFLCLGLNDSHSDDTGVAVGSLTDITSYQSYEDYPDTYYGNYGKIIEQIMEYAPDSKLIMCTIANRESRYEPYIEAAKKIAQHYNIACIVEKEDAFFKSDYYQNYRLNNHPVATMYGGMAMAMNRLFSKCVLKYNNYFEDYIG